MVLSQDQLTAFYEVIRLGSFTKAGQELGLTQSALSHRVKNLEQQLETTLIIRESTGLRLTDAGAKLLKYCRVVLQIEHEFIEDLRPQTKGELSGYLRIGGASTLMWSVITPVLGPVLRENPKIHVEMISREISELPTLLENGNIDFITVCGKLDLPNCEEVYLGDEVNLLVESKLKNSRTNVYLDHDRHDHTTNDYLKQQDKPPTAIKRAFMDDIHGLLAGVEAGLGRAVVPSHLISQLDLKRVKGQKELRTPAYLYYLRQPFYTRLHKVIVETLSNNTAKILKS